MFGIDWNKRYRKIYRQLKAPEVYLQLFEAQYMGHDLPVQYWNTVFCHLCQSHSVPHRKLCILHGSQKVCIDCRDWAVEGKTPPACYSCYSAILDRLRRQCYHVCFGLEPYLTETVLHNLDLARIVGSYIYVETN